jgi:hypothetical protein
VAEANLPAAWTAALPRVGRRQAPLAVDAGDAIMDAHCLSSNLRDGRGEPPCRSRVEAPRTSGPGRAPVELVIDVIGGCSNDFGQETRQSAHRLDGACGCRVVRVTENG